LEILKNHLGDRLSVSEVAAFLGLDEKTVRVHYKNLGGMRLGRQYLFFERSVVDAIQKRTKMGSPSAEGWEAVGEGVFDEEGSPDMGIRDAEKTRRRLGKEDRHGPFG